LKAVLKASILADQTSPPKATGQHTTQEGGSGATDETDGTKRRPPSTYPPKEIVTRNFFAPFGAADMDTDSSGTETTSKEEAVPGKTGRPPPTVLTSTINMIQLQKQLRSVVTRGMADFQSVKSHFATNNLSCYTFYPKSEKPMKAVIRHLPYNTPAEDISDGLLSLGFDVISVKQMTATRRAPSEGSKTINPPLFLITLPRTVKSQELFQLPSLCHIAIRVEA
jgi:hypothetical protein